jgi:hypothetical protein
MRLYTIAAITAVYASFALHAQSFATHPCTDGSSEDHSFISHFFGGSERACEIRSTTFPLVSGRLNVNSQNGSIDIIGEDRQDISVEARVEARADSPAEAASLLHQITINTGATLEAHGPDHPGPHHGWSVSYRLHVPHHLAARLHSLNGGLTLAGLNGTIQGETTNGGVNIDNLAGDVHLTTTNGGIRAILSGATWQGTGLNVTTTNGGVTVSIPQHYSAHLVANTTNGSASLHVPSADQNGVHRRSIDTTLGNGGPTLSFETTNGGITIQ